jgi:hypothetical protein
MARLVCFSGKLRFVWMYSAGWVLAMNGVDYAADISSFGAWWCGFVSTIVHL